MKFSAMFLRHLVHLPSVDIQVKIYADRPSVGVAEYSDFAPIEGYISETVHAI